MKNLTLTPANVQHASKAVWVQFNFNDWQVLTDTDGNMFYTMESARGYVRKHHKTFNVCLATFEQALLNKAEWDNL